MQVNFVLSRYKCFLPCRKDDFKYPRASIGKFIYIYLFCRFSFELIVTS